MSADVAAVIAADKAARAPMFHTAAEVDRWFDHAANRLPVYIAAIEAVQALCDDAHENVYGQSNVRVNAIEAALAVLAPSTDKEQQ